MPACPINCKAILVEGERVDLAQLQVILGCTATRALVDDPSARPLQRSQPRPVRRWQARRTDRGAQDVQRASEAASGPASADRQGPGAAILQNLWVSMESEPWRLARWAIPQGSQAFSAPPRAALDYYRWQLLRCRPFGL